MAPSSSGPRLTPGDGFGGRRAIGKMVLPGKIFLGRFLCAKSWLAASWDPPQATEATLGTDHVVLREGPESVFPRKREVAA